MFTAQKLNLIWNGYYSYNDSSVERNVPESAGVYKISVSQQDKTLKVHYVGQTENIKKRLKEHLDVINEQNKCLAEHIEKYACSYKFALVSKQEDRDDRKIGMPRREHCTFITSRNAMIPMLFLMRLM